MATSLTGLTPSTTYDALIKVGDNGPIDGTLKVLSDGLGNDLPIQASTTAVNFTGALTQSGNTLQPTLVSGTSIKTINSTTLLGSGDIAVQPTLVSGTNIKTLNSVSLLGSGDIVLTANPSGVAGAIQFSDGSAFASDAANFFWNNTTKRLGIGTNAPVTPLEVRIVGSGNIAYFGTSTSSLGIFTDNATYFASYTTSSVDFRIGTGGSVGSPSNTITFKDSNKSLGIGVTPTARLHIQGSGSTSATTSLLVQNSGGTSSLQLKDNGELATYGVINVRSQAGDNGGFIYTSATQNLIISNYNVYGTGSSVNVNTNGVVIQRIPTNNDANASSVLDIRSTTQGVLFPRMTTTQKNAIASPAAGLVVYDSTMNATCEYNGTAWRVVSAGAQSVAASTATTTVDMSAGNVQNITLTASTTLTLSSAAVGTYILKLIQGGSGSYTVTWPGTVIWSGGTAPTLTTTVGKVDIVTLVFDGTNYYGNYSLNY